jgi:hypothetical protein
LTRAGAHGIRFEPFKVLNTPARLVEALSGWALPTDGATPAFKTEHCRAITHVVRMLCGTTETITAEQESAAILSAYLNAATRVEGFTTYGTTGQRYEAAQALANPLAAKLDRTPSAANRHGSFIAPAFLVDANSGEYVIRVSDLAESARRHVGASLVRGWLDGRLSALGWARVTLDGHRRAGREGRTSPHARCDIYRGLLPALADEGSVTT